jgi:RHS repeat-associated protein
VTETGTADNGSPIESDGFALLAYGATSNRITTAGWTYDAAGNQVRGQNGVGAWQRYQYDAAGRLIKVMTDASVEIASYTYGSSNERLMTKEGTLRTYYARSDSAVLADYIEVNTSGVLQWDKSYVYMGVRLLATQQRNGTTESVQYHHPDRLGTRLITNASDTIVQEQATLPYGVALEGETSGATNRRFTSYERNTATGLDYALNRHYDSMQGRFTQADPLGMKAVNFANPQSLNLYAYCGGDPVNLTDPSGLDWFNDHGFDSSTGGFISSGRPYWITEFEPRGVDLGRGTFYGGRLSDEAEAAYAGHVRDSFDGANAQAAWDRGNYTLVASILNANSHVGLSANGEIFWGELGAAFATGYGQGWSEIQLASMQWPIDVESVLYQKGLKAVGLLISKRRLPDSFIVEASAARLGGIAIGGSRAIPKGSTLYDALTNPMKGVSFGAGAGVSFSAGWLGQLDLPNPRDVRSWLACPGFSIGYYKWIGGGLVIAPNSTPTWGIVIGIGAGGFGTVGGYTGP